jgi:DNA-directed RNA polymerase specialized sigma subunit
MNGNYKRGLERLIKEYGIDKVNIAIASLSDQSKKVLNMYFGFDQEPMKISEIAESLCNNSIKQIIFRSIARIESILNGEAKLGVYRTKFADIVEIVIFARF